MPTVRPIFYGWIVVIGALLAMLVGSASLSSFSIFAPELESQFGWTRVMSSWGYTINTIVISVFSLIGGILADRIGIRRLMFIGAAIGVSVGHSDHSPRASFRHIQYPCGTQGHEARPNQPVGEHIQAEPDRHIHLNT